MKISKSYQNLSVKGSLILGDSYTLPSIDGTSGYVLMTDGIGGVTWQSPAMFSINSDDVVEGITNLYFTDERVDDRVSNLILDGTGLTWTYNDALNTLTGNISLALFDADDLGEGITNKYYTAEKVDDQVSNLIQNGTGLVWTYADGPGTLTGNISISSFSSDDLAEGVTNLYFTDERVDDRVSNLIQNGTGISWVYNDGIGTLTPAINLTPFDTDDLSEGSSNLYFQDERVDDRVANLMQDTATVVWSYSDVANTLSADATAAVMVEEGGILKSTRPTLNFIAGTSASITVSDDGFNNRSNILIDITSAGTLKSIFSNNVQVGDSDIESLNFTDKFIVTEPSDKYINIDVVLELSDLENVSLVSPVENDDVLSYNSTLGIWENMQLLIPTTINELLDVTALSPIMDSDVLIYDSLSGMWVNIDNISFVESAGATMNTDLTLVGNSYFLDEDDMISDDPTKVASQQSIKKYVDVEILAAVTGLLDYKGGYDAATNTPDLDTAPSGIQKGDMYTVTSDGQFFSQDVEIGDAVIAETDNPTVLSDWTILETNNAYSLERVLGINNITNGNNINVTNGDSIINDSGDVSIKFAAGSIGVLSSTNDGFKVVEGNIDWRINDVAKFSLDNTGKFIMWDNSYIHYEDPNSGFNVSFQYSATLTGNQIYNFPNQSGVIALTSDIPGTPTLTQVLNSGNASGPHDIVMDNGQKIRNVTDTYYFQVNTGSLNFENSTGDGFLVQNIGTQIRAASSVMFEILTAGTMKAYTFIDYNADYSGSYTARSLVDKEYVDALTGATNLSIGTITGTTIDVNSDTGTNATIPQATITDAGLLIATDKVKLNNTTGTNSGDEVSATETVEGIVERATQVEVDAGSDTTRYISPATLSSYSGLTNIIASSVATTDNTTTEVDKIDTLTDNSTHLIEVKLTCKSDDDARYGTWYVMLNVTKFNGTVNIRNTDTMHHHSSAGLLAGSVTFAVNVGDVDIDVSGINATNIQWDCQYEIITTSTN